jgi:5-methyltetrahydropteroyltriglutamate--homocysteine methyltransferase
MANPGKYRADHVGDLMRPAPLLQAARDFAAGNLDRDGLTRAQDTAIDAALQMQQDTGLDALTDGGFRRADAPDTSAGLEQLFQRRLQSSAAEADYLLAHARGRIKITLPSAAHLATLLFASHRGGAADLHEFGLRLAQWTRLELEALAAQGVHYLQIDSPGYAALAAESSDAPTDERFAAYLAADAASLRGVKKSDECCIAIHFSDPNPGAAGPRGANDARLEQMLSQLPADRFVIPFGATTPGEFECLRWVPKEKTVALGLISSASAALEDQNQVLDRIDQAAAVFEPDNLALCTQGSFARRVGGEAPLGASDERRKLELVVGVARSFWGFEL